MVLNTANTERTRLDWLKWLIAVLILLAGLVGNYYYSDIPMIYRSLAWIGVLVVAGFIASQTSLGKQILGFFRDSRMELRKVSWPTRQETIQTTLVVAAMVVVLALILWGLDGVLVSLIGWLTGQRG